MRPEAEKAIQESADAVDAVIKSYGLSHSDSLRRDLIFAVKLSAIQSYGIGFEIGAKVTADIYREGMK